MERMICLMLRCFGARSYGAITSDHFCWDISTRTNDGEEIRPASHRDIQMLCVLAPIDWPAWPHYGNNFEPTWPAPPASQRADTQTDK